MNAQSIFQNKILVQIAFGQFDMQLHFHESLSVMVSHSIRLENSAKAALWTSDGNHIKIEQFLQFLNQEIVEAAFSEQHGLQIKFVNGVFNIQKPPDAFEYLHVMSKTEGVYIY